MQVFKHLGFCFYMKCNAVDVLWIMMCWVRASVWSPIWGDRVERPVESVPRNASQTRLGYRGSASVPAVRTFRPHLRETERLWIWWLMNVVVSAPTDNPIARARIRRRRGVEKCWMTRKMTMVARIEEKLIEWNLLLPFWTIDVDSEWVGRENIMS